MDVSVNLHATCYIFNMIRKTDNLLTTELITAVIGGIIWSIVEKKLLNLPPKIGSLGIPMFNKI